MSHEKDQDQKFYSGEKVRQGDIILRTRSRRTIFLGGLLGFVIIVVLALGFAPW